MSDTTVKKVDSRYSPKGEMGQKQLVSGRRISMRLWEESPGEAKAETCREYETVGFVVRGRAELVLEGQTILLGEGDSWVVPENATHHYRILEPFTAVEATTPPAQVRGRDRPPEAESKAPRKRART